MIVLEDVSSGRGEAEVAVHASFFPQLEDVGGEVLVTPAQAAALELLEAMTGPDEDEDGSRNESGAASDCRRHVPPWLEDPHGGAGGRTPRPP